MRRNAHGWLGLGVATVALLVAALVAAQGTPMSAVPASSTELAATARPEPAPVVPSSRVFDGLDGQVYLHSVHAENVAAAAARAAQKAADAARRAEAAKEAAKASRSKPGQRSPGAGGGWAALRNCESGGNYANKENPKYRGAYQFSYATWASVGGSGDPANASPEEQDMRARMLFERSGAGQWPRCGRFLR